MPYKDIAEVVGCAKSTVSYHLGEDTRPKARVVRKRLRQELRRELDEYKSTTPCADCGQTYPHYVMDFDHVRGEKMANVSHLARSHGSRTRLFAEIAKCDLVCANCHRERTQQRLINRVAP